MATSCLLIYWRNYFLTCQITPSNERFANSLLSTTIIWYIQLFISTFYIDEKFKLSADSGEIETKISAISALRVNKMLNNGDAWFQTGTKSFQRYEFTLTNERFPNFYCSQPLFRIHSFSFLLFIQMKS